MVAACLFAVSPVQAQVSWVESLGDLQRFDPAPETLPCLIGRYGNPRRGLPASVGHRIQRIGNENRWMVQSGGQVVVMGLNPKTRQPESLEAIPMSGEWCLSPDGRLLFGLRRQGTRWSTECFDLASGKSLWNADKSLWKEGRWREVVDAAFSRDGKQVMVLHSGDDYLAVSWFDATNGGLKHRVAIPDASRCGSVGGVKTNYLGVTPRGLYVSVPRNGGIDEDIPAEVWFIKNGADQGEKVAIEVEPSKELLQVEVGGKNGEYVAFYHEDVVVLYEERKEGRKLLLKMDADITEGFESHPNCVVFSPDQTQLMISACNRTWIAKLKGGERPGIATFGRGWCLGDYTLDGKHFILVDDGGGVVMDVKDFQRVDEAALKENPEHCCPIEEAGFSIQGNYVISSDKRNMILWKKDGEMLAELTSPSEDKEVIMQSPLLIEKMGKIYAADGWDFLEWSIQDIAQRRKRLPGFNPRVAGTPVFRDRPAPIREPEVMNISLDSAGKNLITGTRQTFIYRPLDQPEKKVEIQVPKKEIFWKPRSIQQPAGSAKAIVRSGSSLFEVDPSGKEKATVMSEWFLGFNASQRLTFWIAPGQGGLMMTATPFGLQQQGKETMKLPGIWLNRPERLLVSSSDGKWVVLTRTDETIVSWLSVIDWENKKVVKDFPLYSWATTLSFSPDEKSILVGSSNRGVYAFDAEALKQP